jgi:hypothetical protein
MLTAAILRLNRRIADLQATNRVFKLEGIRKHRMLAGKIQVALFVSLLLDHIQARGQILTLFQCLW